MKLWENWKLLRVLGIIAGTIMGIVFGIQKSQEGNSTTPRTRHRRSTQDECLKKYGGIGIEYTKGSNTSYTFDLCSVIQCAGKNSSWRGYDVYLCGLGWPGNHRWCPTWGHVWQATNLDFHGTTEKKTKSGELKAAGHFRIQRDFSHTQNPITLSIVDLKQDIYKTKATGVPNQCWSVTEGQFYVLVGVDVTGKDPLGLIKITLKEKPVIVTAIEKKESLPPYSMPLLSGDLIENEEDDV